MKSYLRLLAYLKPYIGTVFLAVVLNLIIASLQGISVWVGAEFIERILSGRTTPAMPTSDIALITTLDSLARVLLQRATPFGTVVAGAITLVAARLTIGAFKILKMILIAKVNQSILAQIRNELFEGLTRFDMAFSQQNRPGEVAAIFVKDVDQLNEALFHAIDRAILHPFRLAMIFFLMLGQSVMLTLWFLFFMLIGGTVIHFSGHYIQRLCTLALERISQLQGHLTEYLSSAMLARFMNREKVERRQFNEVSHSISNRIVRIIFMRNLSPQLVRSIFTLAGGMILILGGYQVYLQGGLTAGALLKFILLLPMAVISIEALATLYVAQRVTMASARRVFSLMDSAEPIEEASDAVAVNSFREAVVFDSVGLDLNGETILDNISLTIPAGAKVAICGHSGSGKSTLLALLAGIYRPSRGTITVDGRQMDRIRIDTWRKMLGVVPQESIMINGTVRDNLTYGAPQADTASLETVLQIVQLGPQTGALPKGVETPVGNRGDLLSGGERQRLAIARALLTQPSILIMDEPTSMLDYESKSSVVQAIWNAAQGRSLVLVTHDLNMASKADIRYTLSDGRLTP